MIIVETCPRCGHELINTAIAVRPRVPQKLCMNCGWNWIGEPEEVRYVPFGGNSSACAVNTKNEAQMADCKNMSCRLRSNDTSNIYHCDRVACLLRAQDFEWYMTNHTEETKAAKELDRTLPWGVKEE